MKNHQIESLANEPAPPEVNNRSIGFDIVVYTDGTSVVTYYWILKDGRRIYDGRAHNDQQETAELMSALLFRRHWEESKAVNLPKDKGD